MRSFISILFATCLTALLAFTVSSQGLAQDIPQSATDPRTGYTPINYRELAQTMMMLDHDLASNQKALDGYGELFYCQYYKSLFKDDFAWNKFKTAIHDRITEKREPYRTQFELVTPVEIDRYNFDDEYYPLTAKTQLKNVITMLIHEFTLRSGSSFVPYCGRQGPNFDLPSEIRMTLPRPLTMDRIKIPVDQAQDLLKEIEDENGTGSRKVFARIRLRLTDAAGIQRNSDNRITSSGFTGKIEAIDFFIDSATTMFIAPGPRNL